MSRTLPTPTSASSPPQLPRSIPSDIRDFLLGYPSRKINNCPSANLDFYLGKGPAKPSKLKIDQLQQQLKGNYSELEGNHSFIQWIFPIREMGMNWASQPLEPHEIEGIKADPEAKKRYLESYRIMLDFYGFRLVDEETGLLARTDVAAPSDASWRRRYANLISHSHNYLRITRILKSLDEFGLARYNAPFLLFFLVEQGRGELDSPGLVRSMDTYWRWCIRDAKERDWVVRTIEQVRKEEIEWTEEVYQAAIERRKKTGSFEESEESDDVEVVKDDVKGEA